MAAIVRFEGGFLSAWLASLTSLASLPRRSIRGRHPQTVLSISTFFAATSQNSNVLNARIKTLGCSGMVLKDNTTRMYPGALISREPYGRDLSLTFGENAVAGHPRFHVEERSRSKIVCPAWVKNVTLASACFIPPRRACFSAIPRRRTWRTSGCCAENVGEERRRVWKRRSRCRPHAEVWTFGRTPNPAWSYGRRSARHQ